MALHLQISNQCFHIWREIQDVLRKHRVIERNNCCGGVLPPLPLPREEKDYLIWPNVTGRKNGLAFSLAHQGVQEKKQSGKDAGGDF